MRPLVLAAALAGCVPSPEPPRPPSILLVSIDTLRADRLGCYGNPDGLTPALDAFAAEALLFERAWSQANVTNLSHASLLTSRYPSELGDVSPRFSPSPEIPTLAQVLSTYGYDTAAFVGGGHLAVGFGFERGFDTYQVPQELGSFYHVVPEASRWLDQRDPDTPFFLFVHTYDTHARYLEPSPFGSAYTTPGYRGVARKIVREPAGTSYVLDGRFYPEAELGILVDYERSRVWNRDARDALAARARQQGLRSQPLGRADEAHLRAVYDGAVSYADTWFGLLMEDLEARSLLEDTLVVVVADHGECLGEAGLYCHNLVLNEITSKVPLLVRPPGGLEGGRRVPQQVALLDVLPTVLDLAGVAPPASIHGHSLVPWFDEATGPQHPVVFSEGQFRTMGAFGPTGALIFTGVGANDPLLPDLLAVASVDGPAFASSVIHDAAERERLRQAMLAWRERLHPASVMAEPPDPALLDALQEHGYWRAP
jgi:arylsulfatase A-like enzyme